MPLLDHFHPPLRQRRHWEGFHTMWAGSIVRALNGRLLPAGYFAEAQVHLGSRVEVDVGTFEDQQPAAGPRAGPPAGRGVGDNAGATATLATPLWAPPQASLEVSAVFPDEIEVLVYNDEAGPTIVAAVELVSPGNKDRPESRRAFAVKCAAYLQRGIGLLVVDVVTDRQANLHHELVELLGHGPARPAPDETLYAVAYRPLRRAAGAGTGERSEDVIQVWPHVLAVGAPLPLLPLALFRGPTLPLDLEATYSAACQELRIA